LEILFLIFWNFAIARFSPRFSHKKSFKSILVVTCSLIHFWSILFLSWTNVIGGSPLLLDTFKLQINNKSVETLALEDWPRVPFKKIHIQKNGWKFDMEACISIVNRYRTSVETMEINSLELSFYEMERLLENMENLQKLTLDGVKLFSEVTNPLQLPKLTTLSVIYRYTSTDIPTEILEPFKFNSTIEELLIDFKFLSGGHNSTIFQHGFIETLPKLKYLKLKRDTENEVLLRSDLSQKLETLHIDSLNTDDIVQLLLNQTELKELRLERLPDVNTAAFVRTIYENLDTFYLENALLIRNYEPQHVEEKLDVPWEAGLEILKRGLCE
jgi:hypothetical protein